MHELDDKAIDNEDGGAATQAGIATREAVSLGSSGSFGYDCGVRFDTWEMSAERYSIPIGSAVRTTVARAPRIAITARF